MKKKKIIGAVAILIIVILVAIIINTVNYKNKTITVSNYETIVSEVENSKLTDEEKRQFARGLLKYAINLNEIYGKKIKDIIEEGKNSNILDVSNNKIEETPKDKLTTISNEFVTEIWNEVFCNISHYVVRGTSTMGKKLDIEYTLNKADNIMKQRDEYNNYILSLEGEEYSQIKYIWERLIKEIDRMYARIKEETPRAEDITYKFDTGNFSEYSDDLKKEINKLN